jgi:hypothetical protein
LEPEVQNVPPVLDVQAVSPTGQQSMLPVIAPHVGTHWPEPLHTSLMPQVLLQVPQLAGSLLVSVQAAALPVPHNVWPAGQAHAPFTHCWPPEQAGLQTAVQWPAWHDWPALQVVPQAPQFCGSVLTSTQVMVEPTPQIIALEVLAHTAVTQVPASDGWALESNLRPLAQLVAG